MAEGHVRGRKAGAYSILPQPIEPKILKFEAKKCTCISEIKEGKNAILLKIIYHYLVFDKRNNLSRFC
jgi:hypothetical protein